MPATGSSKAAAVARQCHQALLVLESSEERVKRTSGRRAMVVAVTPNRTRRPPASRLTQEVVLARIAAGRDVAKHVKDEPDCGLMIWRILASTERLHAVRDIKAVEFTMPMHHCPIAQI